MDLQELAREATPRMDGRGPSSRTRVDKSVLLMFLSSSTSGSRLRALRRGSARAFAPPIIRPTGPFNEILSFFHLRDRCASHGPFPPSCFRLIDTSSPLETRHPNSKHSPHFPEIAAACSTISRSRTGPASKGKASITPLRFSKISLGVIPSA